MEILDYSQWFSRLTQHAPHPWQVALAAGNSNTGSALPCRDQLIRIPTGLGKTSGTVLAWLWNRQIRHDHTWPCRLIFCLPMRVLVEQTEAEVRQWLTAAGLLWDGPPADHAGKVGVHLLMGGADSGEWQLYPEHPAILIGTQDMLLSRALNRGYAAPRARWPMEFGLLNQDCLWIMDEVQLMDVGLATSGQLQAFRTEDRAAGKELRPCHTWWMSATLQRGWLAKSPETANLAGSLPHTAIPPDQRRGPLWETVRKPCTLVDCKDAVAVARRVKDEHLLGQRGVHGPTLVIMNTVERAVQVFDALLKEAGKSLKGTDIRLVHSRFRPHERAAWRTDFLRRTACAPGTDRIVVATQVVEAGVDFSAGLLVTELAPWSSLIQRFGRCARWGGEAQVLVADLGLAGEKALPYEEDALAAARTTLAQVTDVAPVFLEQFEETHPELLPALYPYDPKHLLLRHELEELFDTTPDLTGADIDISRFIRSGKERDLTVFWAEIPLRGSPDASLQATREALCPVPFLKARKWLCGKEDAKTSLAKGQRAWVWDWLAGQWRPATGRDLYPGQTVLVAAASGGYDLQRGWSPDSTVQVPSVPTRGMSPDNADAATQDGEPLSANSWQTIAFHGRAVGRAANDLALPLAPALASLFDLAGRWHDVGKAHPAFAASIRHAERPPRADLAKAPSTAWLPVGQLYPAPDGGPRRAGLRHELVSTLALFAVLQRHAPDHPALLGAWRDVLIQAGFPVDEHVRGGASPTPVEQEILALDAPTFNLLAYLVCAHHGKLRLAWHACPADQQSGDSRPRIRGVVAGDTLPALILANAAGCLHPLPAACLDLSPAAAGLSPRTGPSWTERVLGLIAAYGPFTLAWLEALLRAADMRTSQRQDLIDDRLHLEAKP